MKIISVQSTAGGTGVTLMAAELALKAAIAGKSVLAVDTTFSRDLVEDIQHGGFWNTANVEHLFEPESEAVWEHIILPRCGLVSYPSDSSHRVKTVKDGVTQIVYRERLGRQADAFANLKANIATLGRSYDVMIVDVQNKDKYLMQMFYDVSDEVHLMLRNNPSRFCNLEVWRKYIERPAEADHAPIVIEQADRQDVPSKLDGQGYSKKLRPFLEAARPGGLDASPFDHPFEFAKAQSR